MFTFEEMYETYAADVYRFALLLSGDRAEAEDITSDTFVRAWTSNSPIRTVTLKAYLFTIARNQYLEQQRKIKRQVILYDIHPDPAPGPERIVDSTFELRRVHRFLQTLPESDRTALILRAQNELPYAEIAKVLDISLSAAKVKVHRARKRILNALVDGSVGAKSLVNEEMIK
jgi:RNA polymerase sigma-70 factor (ECF subfamily)